MSASSPRRRCLVIAFALLPVMVFVYVTVGLVIVHGQNGVAFSFRNAGTDLEFASSGGHWLAEENLLRGRHFTHIVVAHELYKIQCDRPGSILVRTKARKRPWNWAYWFDDYDDAKWRVPYVPTPPAALGERCVTRPGTAAETAAAEEAARQTIARLTGDAP